LANPHEGGTRVVIPPYVLMAYPNARLLRLSKYGYDPAGFVEAVIAKKINLTHGV
jgi:hypothetical protein